MVLKHFHIELSRYKPKKNNVEKFSFLVLNHGAGKMGESLQDV